MTECPIKPIGNNVVAKAFKEDFISAGGIIVPDYLRKDSDKIEILAVGNGTKKRPMTIRPGIAYRIHQSGTPVKIGEETFYILDQNYILATEQND